MCMTRGAVTTKILLSAYVTTRSVGGCKAPYVGSIPTVASKPLTCSNAGQGLVLSRRTPSSE